MEKTYNPNAIEQAIYQNWEDKKYFRPSMDKTKPAFSICLPPPNVTGSLHMGHAFQQTIMDILIRYHRMLGDNTLWQAGTDHAGIATQMVVERKIAAEENKTRHDYGRDAFIKKIWEWKEQSGGTITRQMRRLGTSVDWDRERFTMDEGLSAAVQEVFIRLYKEDLIYRGKRLVNWDPKLRTAISDLEVENKEVQGYMWHIRYHLADGKKTSEGKDYISEDGTTAEGFVNSDEAVKTTAFLANFIAKGYANVDPITDEFLNKACATMIGGSWEVATLTANADFDWGVTYYPVADDTKKAVSPCGDWSAAVTRDCKNVEAAGQFLQWLMGTENVASYAAAIAKPATRATAYDDPAMADYKEFPLSLLVEQLQNTAVPRPRTPSYATFSTDYAEAMTNILAEAASNGTVDETYIKEQLDGVSEKFTEDYTTYYAE